MKPSTIVALANHFTKLARPIKGNLTVGVHTVEETVTIRANGTIKKSDDYERAATCEIRTIDTMAIILQSMGCTREQAINKIVEGHRLAYDYANGKYDCDGKREELEQTIADMEAARERVRQEIIARLPKVKANGAASVKVTVEEARFDDDLLDEAA